MDPDEFFFNKFYSLKKTFQTQKTKINQKNGTFYQMCIIIFWQSDLEYFSQE